MSRFKVMTIEEAAQGQQVSDPEYLLDGYDPYYDYGDVLVDTATNTVLWKDGMEPEDATLRRDLRFFVKLLNAVSEETGGDD